jgi:DNA transposition AAA+ family ATPase
MYEDAIDRSYVERYQTDKLTTSQVADAEAKRLSTEIAYSAPGLSGDIEDAETFTNRVEAELNGMGVKAEKTEEVPDWF